MAEQRREEEAPREVWLRRRAFQLMGMVHPAVGGRAATDFFLQTRGRGTPLPAGAPLGAKGVPLGAAGIGEYFVWDADGPTALLVHGWGSDSSSMYAIAAALQRIGIRAVAYDGPAHGASAGSITTMRAVVDGVAAVARAQGQVDLIVGHSLGAVASVAATAEACGWTPGAMVTISAPAGLDGALRAFARYWRLSEPVVNAVRRELHDRNGVPIEYWDIPSLAESFDMPALVVHDETDVFVDVSESERVYPALGAADCMRTRDLGHARILSDAKVLKAVSEFAQAHVLSKGLPNLTAKLLSPAAKRVGAN